MGWSHSLRIENLESRRLLAGDAAAAAKVEGLAIVTSDAVVVGNELGPVAGFVDVLVEAPSGFVGAASGYEIDLSFVGDPAGITFTGASPVPLGDALFVGQQPITLGSGGSLKATDFLNSGTAALTDGKALLRANFTVDVGVSGVFTLEFDSAFTNIVDRNAQPFAVEELRGGTVSVGSVAIPQASVLDAQVVEGDSGATPMAFTVQLSAAAAQDVQVDYFTTSQTATSGLDYSDAVGTLTIPAGATSGQIIVNVLGDEIVEANETFRLTLTSPVGVSLNDAQAVGTILDDDVVGNPAPWQNAELHEDINANGIVTPQDVIILVNDINANGSRVLPAPSGAQAPPPFYDANGDGSLTPADVVAVVNLLNQQTQQATAKHELAADGISAADAAVSVLFSSDDEE